MRGDGGKGIAPAVAASIVTTVLAGCGGNGSATNQRSPQGYLDHALQLVQQHAIYAPAFNWRTVAGHAQKLAADAKTRRGTYPAIRYVIDRLQNVGDEHAFFLDPATAKRYAVGSPALDAPSPPPSISILDGRLGLIDVPAISSSPRSANSRRYATKALASIRQVEARHHLCGWVVDLRSNTGGDMYPMLLSVGPIVGEGRLVGFSSKRGFQYFVSYRRGVLSGGGFTDSAPLDVPDLKPMPAVAVLIGGQTASSGEAVAVAFRGRPKTRSFGSETYGAMTSAGWYRLSDGAVLALGTSYDVDRDRVVYKQPLEPDVDVSMLGSGDPPLRTAAAWLLDRPECKSP